MKKANLAKILLWTFVISTIILTVAIIIIQENGRYEDPEDMYPNHNCDMSGIAYGIAVGFNILLTILASTIFLNVYETIRNTFWYSFASFFLLPLVITIYFEITLGEEIYLFTLPFFAVLAIFFYRFQKRNSKLVN